MKKKLKRLLTLILATCMILGTVSISAAEEAWEKTPLEPGKGKFTKSKTATDWIDDVYADVTLNVGGNSEDMSSDIVFIIGHGPASNYDYIVKMVQKMLVAADSTPTKIKIGMVGFADTTEEETVLPLTEMKDVVAGNNVADYRIEERYNDGKQYTESLADYQARVAAAYAKWESDNPLLPQDMEYIIAKALERAEEVYGGINLESALITARDMLIADDTVPADRKHMIAISTGLTYWFDNDAGEPVTIIGTNKFGTYMHGNKYWLQARDASTNTGAGYYMKGWMVVNGEDGKPDYQASWNRYWNMIVGWIAADQDAYVYNPGKTYSEFYYNGNSTEIRPQNNANYRYGYAIQNAEDIAKVTGAVPYFDGGANPATNKNAAHALNYERAQYESWVVYKQMETPIGESFTTALGKTVEGLGFNCYSIANGVSAKPGEEDRWLASNQIGYNFMHMLGGENTVNYRDGDNSFFLPIENKILHGLSSGSHVIDYIGYNDDPEKGDIYNFDFVDVDEVGENGTPTLKVGKKEYITEKLEQANGEATSSYIFKASEEAEQTFTLDYYQGDGKENEYFIWTFYEDVSEVKPVSLTYRVKLMDKNEMPGTYTVYTNQSATLYPKDSLDKEGTPELFERPTLTYKADGVNINVTKSWDDDSDRDRIRPSEVKIRLFIENREELALSDDQTIDTINGTDIVEEVILNADNNWQYNWSGLRKFLNRQEIVYAVEEINDPEVIDNLDKYEASLNSETKNNVNYITVTNTYKPEETTVSVEKVWDDASNQDGLQPTSIQVELLADGKVLEDQTVELNAANEWKHIWTVWKNEAGKQIVYTVQEVPLEEAIQDEYTVAVTGGINDDGVTYSYTITNTHIPYVRDISVNKVWDDENNIDGIRPESVTVNLLANGVVLTDKTVVLDESNEWGYVWENLPVNETPGTPIVYTVEEVLDNEVLKNEYTTVVSESEEVPGVFTITNTHEPYKTSVTVNKEWVDQDNKYGFRTDSVQVQLLADDEPYGEVITLNSENNWTYTWDGLYVNKLDENGETKEINYTVKEVNVPRYYDVTVTDLEEAKTTDAEGKTVYNYTITNSLKKTSIVLTKYINKMDPENATSIFRYLITGGPNGDYRANVTINFENGTVKVNGVVQGEADTDLRDNIGFDKAGLSVTIDGLESGDYTIIEYAARGYELVQMSDGITSISATNGVQNPLTVTAIANDPGEAYYWNRYNVPTDYTAVNRFSVSELGNLSISIKRK